MILRDTENVIESLKSRKFLQESLSPLVSNSTGIFNEFNKDLGDPF